MAIEPGWIAKRVGGLTRLMQGNAKSNKRRATDTCDIARDAVIHSTANLHNLRAVKSAICVGSQSHVRGELLVFGHGGDITIGRYCYIGEQTRIWSAKTITIGDRVLISHLCTVMDSLTHPLNPDARHAQFKAIITGGHPREIDLDERSVIIEDDVLIGCHSVVLRGVKIGHGAVIGAGSVVTGDIPPLVVAAGNPARVIRPLTESERAPMMETRAKLDR